jgi:hypothetical protein
VSAARPALAPLSGRELETLQALLDAVPAPLEPLDLVALDGYLCGVLVQPGRIAPARWLAHVADAEGRPLPRGYDTAPLHALVRRRHAELEAAIVARRWFDPWVFEVEADAASGEDARTRCVRRSFPGSQVPPRPSSSSRDDAAVARYDARAAGAALPPPRRRRSRRRRRAARRDRPRSSRSADLGEAVEQLVRAILLLADAAAGAP